MRLEIHRVEARDFTSYKCVAKNSLGETDGKIRLFGNKSFTLPPISCSYFFTDDVANDVVNGDDNDVAKIHSYMAHSDTYIVNV